MVVCDGLLELCSWLFSTENEFLLIYLHSNWSILKWVNLENSFKLLWAHIQSHPNALIELWELDSPASIPSMNTQLNNSLYVKIPSFGLSKPNKNKEPGCRIVLRKHALSRIEKIVCTFLTLHLSTSSQQSMKTQSPSGKRGASTERGLELSIGLAYHHKMQ